jgi:hypothetical protein
VIDRPAVFFVQMVEDPEKYKGERLPDAPENDSCGGEQERAYQWCATWPSSGSSGRPCSSQATSPPSIE